MGRRVGKSSAQAYKEQAKAEFKPKEKKKAGPVLSTGSTLLDLSCYGGRVRGGGIPAGFMVEIFGPPGTGKTVILYEMMGSAKRNGGDCLFADPECRLDIPYMHRTFGFGLSQKQYCQPITVPQMFSKIRKWKPEGNAPHIIASDALAALSTDTEQEKDAADNMAAARRAAQFSQELRKTNDKLSKMGAILACANQIRANIGGYGYTSPGGHAIEHYATIRVYLKKEKELKKVVGVDERVWAVKSTFEIKKNSIDTPYRKGVIYIDFNYGIDDIRANLEWIKKQTKANDYLVDGEKISTLPKAVAAVEQADWELQLRENTIDLWQELETKFRTKRRPKERW